MCQEDIYLLELVRYIHLNAIRAGIVGDLTELARYAYSGHSVLMGKAKKSWQDTEGVLGMFGQRVGGARRAYRAFVEKGMVEGKRQAALAALVPPDGSTEGPGRMTLDQFSSQLPHLWRSGQVNRHIALIP